MPKRVGCMVRRVQNLRKSNVGGGVRAWIGAGALTATCDNGYDSSCFGASEVLQPEPSMMGVGTLKDSGVVRAVVSE
jgi:hypothetical protein